MEFEELNDMAIIATQRRLARAKVEQTLVYSIKEFGKAAKKAKNSLKKANTKQKSMEEEISNCIILLMFLASQYKINLEDAILNKIEGINKK